MADYNWREGLFRVTVIVSISVGVLILIAGFYYGEIEKAVIVLAVAVPFLWLLYYLVVWIIDGFNSQR